MAKKSAAKVKRTAAKSKKTNASRGSATAKNATAPPPVKRPSLMDDPRFAQAVQNYEAGLKLMQARKFERAKALLEKVKAGGIKELADRATLHLNTCEQQLARTPASNFKSHEEHFDYAISLMNAGAYEECRGHLEKLQKQSPKADYVWYGFAVLDCLTRQYESALKHLTEAIRLDSANRFRARNEPDFQNLSDDPRFTELLYPEPGTMTPAPAPAPAEARNSKRR